MKNKILTGEKKMKATINLILTKQDAILLLYASLMRNDRGLPTYTEIEVEKSLKNFSRAKILKRIKGEILISGKLSTFKNGIGILFGAYSPSKESFSEMAIERFMQKDFPNVFASNGAEVL